MCDGPMKQIAKIGKYPIYFAGKGFIYRGIWTWNGKDNVRLLAFNHFSNWRGTDND